MLQLATRVIAALVFVTSVGFGAIPPERGIALDFTWIAAPTMSSVSSGATATRMRDFVRLSSIQAESGSEMLWTLRYPIDVTQYPEMVIRYRSATMDAGKGRPVVSLIPQAAGESPFAVMRVDDVVQDSYLQEFRADLSGKVTGTINGLAVALPPGVLRFDLVDVRFEAKEGKPAAGPIRQQVQLVLRDDQGKALNGAEVKVGPLERANWVVSGRSAADGAVMLNVNVPREGGSPRGTPVEAAIDREGYQSQYIAHVDAGQGATLAANLTPVQPRPTETASAAAPTPVIADTVASTSTPIETPLYSEQPSVVQNYYYNDYNDNYYDDGWRPYGRYGGWGGYYPGYLIIHRHHHHDDDDDDDDDGDGPDDPPGTQWPEMPPLPDNGMGVPVIPAPRHTMQSSPVYGVLPAPTYGAFSAPAHGVRSAPGINEANDRSRSRVSGSRVNGRPSAPARFDTGSGRSVVERPTRSTSTRTYSSPSRSGTRFVPAPAPSRSVPAPRATQTPTPQPLSDGRAGAPMR